MKKISGARTIRTTGLEGDGNSKCENNNAGCVKDEEEIRRGMYPARVTTATEGIRNKRSKLVNGDNTKIKQLQEKFIYLFIQQG